MPDTFGAVSVPLDPTIDQPGEPGSAVQDPFLRWTLAFIKAFLLDDANAKDAWDRAGVAPGYPIVKVTNAWNPSEQDHRFNENELPAIFMWRDGEAQDGWIADDWEVQTTPVKLLWIFPVAKADIQTTRSPFVDALAKAIKIGIERGRTPSLKVAGDPDKLAGEQGLLFYLPAGIMTLRALRHRPANIMIPIKGVPGVRPPMPRTYRGLEMSFELKERMKYGLDRYTAFSGGTDLTMTINDGPQKVEARNEPE